MAAFPANSESISLEKLGKVGNYTKLKIHKNQSQATCNNNEDPILLTGFEENDDGTILFQYNDRFECYDKPSLVRLIESHKNTYNNAPPYDRQNMDPNPENPTNRDTITKAEQDFILGNNNNNNEVPPLTDHAATYPPHHLQNEAQQIPDDVVPLRRLSPRQVREDNLWVDFGDIQRVFNKFLEFNESNIPINFYLEYRAINRDTPHVRRGILSMVFSIDHLFPDDGHNNTGWNMIHANHDFFRPYETYFNPANTRFFLGNTELERISREDEIGFNFLRTHNTSAEYRRQVINLLLPEFTLEWDADWIESSRNELKFTIQTDNYEGQQGMVAQTTLSFPFKYQRYYHDDPQQLMSYLNNTMPL